MIMIVNILYSHSGNETILCFPFIHSTLSQEFPVPSLLSSSGLSCGSFAMGEKRSNGLGRACLDEDRTGM